MHPEDVRDFIMVVTVEGEVATLPLHLIERVQGTAHPHPLAAVVMKELQGRPGPTLLIQETAECFLTRCEGLHVALLQKDLTGINRHLAPMVGDLHP